MVLLGIVLFPGRRSIRLPAGLLALLFLALLVLSTSPDTWIVLGVCVTILLWWRSRWLLLSVPALAGLMYWSLTDRVGRSWHEVWHMLSTFNGRRTDAWPSAAEAIGAHPVAGCGLGGYTYPAAGLQSHNAYLQFYCDFGLLGAVALLVAVLIFARLAFQIKSASADNNWTGIGVGACIAILVGLIYSIIEIGPAAILVKGETTNYYAISPLFAFLGAGLVVAHRALVGENPVLETGERDFEGRSRSQTPQLT